MSQVKERQILFSGPMVRAILEGRKTVTRRVVKPQYLEGPWSVKPAENPRHERHSHDWWLPTGSQPYAALPHCPYGKPGDRLWVRESLGYDCEYGHYFAAGGKHGETVYLCSLFDDEDAQTGPSYDGLLPERSVPSIHLHRRYSRILLEITAVRVERLQAITWEQALDEGIGDHRFECDRPVEPDGYPACSCGSVGYVDAFADLWNSTGGDWDANPWVWVVEFRRVQP
ncbi:hypothetical protein K1T36_21010 [Pseudomonas protegens]|uniref:hypothetical protein n=1 Tax=Pseudomonas protegens TaxID=380021 RepID=UPI001C69A0D1|nr:hypothetical protein [Pseudomonas protegens]QYM99547.1 hypothetical protein K1T36_21010 [Pseudomonas protegens]